MGPRQCRRVKVLLLIVSTSIGTRSVGNTSLQCTEVNKTRHIAWCGHVSGEESVRESAPLRMCLDTGDHRLPIFPMIESGLSPAAPSSLWVVAKIAQYPWLVERVDSKNATQIKKNKHTQNEVKVVAYL